MQLKFYVGKKKEEEKRKKKKEKNIFSIISLPISVYS